MPLCISDIYPLAPYLILSRRNKTRYSGLSPVHCITLHWLHVLYMSVFSSFYSLALSFPYLIGIMSSGAPFTATISGKEIALAEGVMISIVKCHPRFGELCCLNRFDSFIWHGDFVSLVMRHLRRSLWPKFI